MKYPIKLDIGCGLNKKPGFYGIDIMSGPQVDRVVDIVEEGLPFPDNTVEEIYSNNVFEHIPFTYRKPHPGRNYEPLYFVMEEIWRVCKNGTLIEIRVPHETGHMGAKCDHPRFYNTQSFVTTDECSYRWSEHAVLTTHSVQLRLYKGFQVWNYPMEWVLNKSKWLQTIYESSPLKFLFPARQVIFVLKVKK